MKYKHIAILLVGLVFLSGCVLQNFEKNEIADTSHENEKNYTVDEDFLEFAITRWTGNPFEKENLPKFDFLKSFFKQVRVRNELVLSDDFLRKPSMNNLIVIYLQSRLEQNASTFESESYHTVVEKGIKNLPSEEVMLVKYYNHLFDHLRLNFSEMSPCDFNIDFAKLGLNKTESTILYLSAMSLYQTNIQRKSKSSFPDNCNLIIEFGKIMPKFDGLKFHKYKLPEFTDFEITNKSYKAVYIPYLNNLKSNYKMCLNR